MEKEKETTVKKRYKKQENKIGIVKVDYSQQHTEL